MEMNFKLLVFAISCIFISSCIGDDYVDDEVEPMIVISNPLNQIQIDSSYQFEYIYFNNIGAQEQIEQVIWSSSSSEIINIAANGLAQALALGTSVITVEVENPGITIRDELTVEVTEMPEDDPDITKSGSLMSTSSYELEGSFTIMENDDNLIINFANDYVASSALPGLFVYLSNNPNTISNAFEIGAVSVFSGSHSYEVSNIGINDYQYLLYFCKPFNVKVGDGKID